VSGTVRRSVVVMFAGVLAAGCGSGNQPASGQSTPTDAPPPARAATVDPANINPADFVTSIDNPFFSLRPGAKFRYEATTDEGSEVVVVEVTNQTKPILGVPAVVVRDTVTVSGEVTEDTFDWFTQDRAGNVWYFGEDTKEYEEGRVVSTAGSWEAGVDGAQPGIVMPAQPKVGDKYRQEFYKGEAEDQAEVLSVAERATVPYGTFHGLVMTRDTTPLEPNLIEHKYYARGVGLVLAVAVKGGSERLELVDITK
jgi:hypothetical protein